MAVALRVTGTWAELTTDGAVAIPATPQAGDRMYLFARWKDFSVTAQVTSPVTWDEIAEFTDGAVTAGNGTGSVKVACWYRDWQSGDTNPTIDFSATVENASVVIMVMAKGADDVWTTPVARSAAMTNWTTTSQIVAASASVVVPSSSVVMGLIGIRDDSATMTRPSTGIDDSTGAITWNGDYVESPVTHHSTTTGFDGATDLGYRLVTTGATATLRMTGTISAAETGAALWVIQGVDVLVTPSTASLTLATFVPVLKIGIVPAIAMLAITTFAPTLRANVIPSTAALTTATFAPQLQTSVTPPNVNLTVTSFSPTLSLTVTPATQSLTLAAFAPSLPTTVTPGTASLTVTTDAPLVGIVTVVTPAALSLSITRFVPHALPFKPVWLDPGGDAVQAIGYFGAQVGGSGGVISFDTAQKVNGVGSWKFDSGDVVTNEVPLITGESPTISVSSVMGASRRVSTYFRYGSVPDATSTSTAFAEFSNEIYSGGGFTDPEDMAEDVADTYATATPAQNAGQGTRFGSFGFASGSSGLIPINAFIQSVKIIYERKYDTAASIGISRVKWVVNGDEGPDHDNTDQPLTDTVVTVDVTADRPLWTREDLANLTFEVIAEARRGNTSTAHTQSWDYVKVEVVWYIATTILAPSGTGIGFELALAPKGAGTVLRFIDGDGASYDGITQLDIDTWNRFSFSYFLHDTTLVDIKLYVNGIEELSIVDAACEGGISNLVNLLYGWVAVPGENHLCWFDQLYIDDGSNLSDTGNKLMTAKLGATVNDDDWNTDGGTGAVNERPVSVTNYKEHDSPFDPQRQTYTLQAANVGDVDLSGKTLVGHMGWAWAAMRGTFDASNVKLIVNGIEVNRSSLLQSSTSPRLLTLAATSTSYPSNARGIGMLSNEETFGTVMYECGVIVAYEGPAENILLPFQLLAEDSLTPLTDDLRAAPPTSYELCYRATDSSAVATITVSSLDQEGGEIQQQAVIPLSGGSGRWRITPGIEVQVSVLVTGGDISMEIWHRMNFD